MTQELGLGNKRDCKKSSEAMRTIVFRGSLGQAISCSPSKESTGCGALFAAWEGELCARATAALATLPLLAIATSGGRTDGCAAMGCEEGCASNGSEGSDCAARGPLEMLSKGPFEDGMGPGTAAGCAAELRTEVPPTGFLAGVCTACAICRQMQASRECEHCEKLRLGKADVRVKSGLLDNLQTDMMLLLQLKMGRDDWKAGNKIMLMLGSSITKTAGSKVETETEASSVPAQTEI